MVQLPPNSGKQNLSALLERLILDTFDEVSTRRQGGGRSGANAAVIAANVALIYGGDGAQPYDGTSKLPDRGATAAADGMADVMEGLGGSVGGEGNGKDKDRTLPFIVQLCQDCSEEVKAQAAGAVKCLALPTKIALVEAGALRSMVEMIGVHALEALLHLIAGQDPAGDGGDVAEWAAGVARLALSAPDDAVRADAAIRPIVQMLELGSSRGRQEAASALHALCAVGDSMKFGIAREGAFEPLVKLLGTGTASAREQAAGALWRQLEMMRENAFEVNISVPRVQNLVEMLKQGSEQGKEAAAAVLRFCANSERNRASIMRGKAVEPLVDLLQTSPPKVRTQVGLALRALCAPEDPGADGSMAPLGPHATWMTRASAEAANLVELLESGELQEGTSAKFTIPAPLATLPAPPQPAIFEGDGDDGNGKDGGVVVVNADEAVRLPSLFAGRVGYRLNDILHGRADMCAIRKDLGWLFPASLAARYFERQPIPATCPHPFSLSSACSHCNPTCPMTASCTEHLWSWAAPTPCPKGTPSCM
jgi:hypothetical protein